MNAHEHSDTDTEYDLVVVGGGNAAFLAAHAGRERGARVLMLEKAAREEAGGNSFYTAGAFRVAHDGLPDLLPLVDDASRERADHTVLPPYPAEHFHRDVDTRGQPIPGLYAAGELVGGLFWGNYPGGSGLTAGTVLGRIAGHDAADSL